MKKILFLSFFVLTFSTSHAQWTLTNGPESAVITEIKADSNILYSAAWGAGVFRSLDNGNSWTNVSSGLSNLFTTGFTVDKGKIYVAVQFGPLYMSVDSGNTWTSLGLPTIYSSVRSISAVDSVIVVITNTDSVRLSVDFGMTWRIINYQFANNNLYYPTVKDTNVFASVTGSGVYRMGINDTTWIAANNGLSNLNTKFIKVCGNSIFVGTGAGLYHSLNNGNSWSNVTNGITNNAIQFLDINGSQIVAVDSTLDVFLSSDSGSTWTDFGICPSKSIANFCSNGIVVLVGTTGLGVNKTTNNGLTWTDANNGLVASYVYKLFTYGTDLYAFTPSHHTIFKTSDFGNNWVQMNIGWPSNFSIYGLATDGNNIYVSAGSIGIYKSSNGGATWTNITTGLTNVSVNSIAINGNKIYAGTFNNGVYVSTNSGNNWSPLNNGISSLDVNTFCFRNNDIFIGTSNGVHKSSNGGVSWAILDSGSIWTGTIHSILSSGNHIYALSGGLDHSIDNGISWNSVFTLPSLTTIAISGNNIYHGTSYYGISTSAFGATSSTSFSNGLLNRNILSLATIGNLIFAGTYGGAVYVAQALPTSLEEEGNISSELKIYPNPASEEISLEWLNHDISTSEIQIINLMGQRVNTAQLNKDLNQKLYVGNLPSGIFLISIRDKDEVVTRKFLKQ